MWETRVRFLGWEDSLGKGMTTHSSILAWRIPWSEEPGRLQSLSIYIQTLLTSLTHGKASADNVGDPGLIPRLGRSSGEGNGTPLQFSCLENPTGRRILVGYSPWVCKESDTTSLSLYVYNPWGHKESDMTEWLSLHLTDGRSVAR